MRPTSCARARAMLSFVCAAILATVVDMPATAQGPDAPEASPAADATGAPRPDQLTVFTDYPSIVVDRGGEAIFPLTVQGPEPERVDLTLEQVPEGFQGSFRGGGTIVRSVYTGGPEPPDLELRLLVPEDAVPGEHPVLVSATAPSGATELALEVSIADVSEGSVSLNADFPALRGSSEDTFSFDLDLENDTSSDIDFVLAGEGPPGWDVNVRPSGEEQAATLQVAAGDSERIQATVTPPFRAEAGVHPVAVRVSGGDHAAEALLSVEITGSYELELTSVDGRLDTSVPAGGSGDFGLVVVNTGTAPLNGISLDADAPRGWEVTFDPEQLEIVPPEQSARVRAVITPPGDAVAGDYLVTLTADSDDAAGEVLVRTTVETSLTWGIVSVGLIALVLVGLGLVFRRYGRR